MPKYQHDPLAVYPMPPAFTPEQLKRRTEEMWREQLDRATAKIAEAASWNERTGGIVGVQLDCLEVRALHQRLMQNGKVCDAGGQR